MADGTLLRAMKKLQGLSLFNGWNNNTVYICFVDFVVLVYPVLFCYVQS